MLDRPNGAPGRLRYDIELSVLFHVILDIIPMEGSKACVRIVERDGTMLD